MYITKNGGYCGKVKKNKQIERGLALTQESKNTLMCLVCRHASTVCVSLSEPNNEFQFEKSNYTRVNM